MPVFEQSFNLTTSPFEQYVAENEPNILSYAVAPPYFEVARKRAATPSTHLLFGARGAGKSATRLATEREIWKRHSTGEKVPLVVPFVDFSRLLDKGSLESVTSDALIKELAFAVVETLLLWISDQEEGIQTVELLEQEELTLFVSLTKSFYFPIPEANRAISHDKAMRLLHQNWRSKSTNWVQQKWSVIGKLVGKVTSEFLEKHATNSSVETEITSLLTKDGAIISGTAVLNRLVEVARLFGFNGIAVFVDKIDEHPKTQNSPEDSAKLIHPILAQVQLLEVDGLGWQMFLWDRMKALFSEGKLGVRLDKIAHSEIAWSDEFLRSMVNARLKFFSDGRIKSIEDLGDSAETISAALTEAIELSGGSPRELIRLMDTVVREYDAKYAASDDPRSVSEADFTDGMDKYVSDVIWGIYDSSILSQILRLDKLSFINKDVQQAFRMSAPGATNRIVKWESSGAVRLTGTRAAEGGAGGKPSNEYTIIDPRIQRLAKRKLYDEKILTEAPIDMD